MKQKDNFSFKLIGLLFLITIFNCKVPSQKNNSNNEIMSESKSKLKLVYYYDPLCGWCYGFSSVVSKVEEKYGNQLDIEVVSGGLFLESRAGAINEVAPHIKAGAYKSVESRTGVKFGEAFLADVFGEGKITLNSLPPTIALCIVKEKHPEQELKFAELLLKAVYFDGLDPTNIEGLATYALKVGFDKEEFKTKMNDSKYRDAAEKEFEIFRNSPHSGMPALVLSKDGEEHSISYGYVNFEELDTKLESFLD